MKKKLVYLFIILVGFVPTIVFADMGMPTSPEYYATVNEPLKCIDEYGDNHTYYLNPGVEYLVTYYNSIRKGSLKESVIVKYSDENDGVYCQVDDINKLNFSKFKDDVKLINTVEKARTVGGSVKIYNGPSIISTVIGNIPQNTDFTYTVVESNSIEDPDGWGYIEFNGTKGYFFIYDCNVWVYNKYATDFYSLVDTKLNNIINKGNDLVINKFNKISYPAYSNPYCSSNLKAETRFINNSIYEIPDLMLYVNDYTYEITLERDLRLYTDTKDFSIYKNPASFDGINKKLSYFEIAEDSKYTLIPKGTVLYSNIMGDIMYTPLEYYYVEYNGEKGIIVANGGSLDGFSESEILVNDSNKKLLVPDKLFGDEPISVSNEETTITTKTDDSILKEIKKNKSSTSINIVVYCVIGGVILAITAFVTIILVNKKKKSKKVEEVKENTDSNDAYDNANTNDSINNTISTIETEKDSN